MSDEQAPAGQLQLPSPLDQVAAGKLKAITIPPVENRGSDPLQEFLITNFGELGSLGLSYHDYPSDYLSVIFNPKLTSEKELDAAKKAGKLEEISPLVGGKSPAPAEAPAAEGGAAPTPDQSQPAAEAPSGPLASAKVPTNRRIQSARLANTKIPGTAVPNSPVDQLAKRPI